MEFQRFTAPDAIGLETNIQETCAKLTAAVRANDSAAIVEHAADLGSMLTTARKEAEALQILNEHVVLAESLAAQEAAGWFWNAYATALQYVGRRDEANDIFSKALVLTRAGGWQRLQSFVLQHWGRSQVEQGRWSEAEASFSEALRLRQQLNDPRLASTQRALTGLAQLRQSQVAGETPPLNPE